MHVFTHINAGTPSVLPKNSLSENVARATKELLDQSLRNPSTYSSKSSNRMQDPDEEEDMAEESSEIWKLLPQLANVPESTLRKLPLSAIFQLSNALTKSSKLQDKMTISSRLALNADNSRKNPVQVASGLDNRRDMLHEGRFLGGAGCSMTDMWTRGKEVVGPKGPKPLGNYDMDAVGCGGCVTAKGWSLLHDPSSQELRVKHFYLPNVAGSSMSSKRVTIGDSGEDFSIGDSLKDINDLDGYRGALNVMREAMASAMPWNRSVSAIVGFMCNTNYLQTDLSSNPKRATILAEFTDYVLGRNALNWDNGQSFITTDEMAHIWGNWKGKRVALFTTSKEKTESKKGGGGQKSHTNQKNDICRKYNAKVCPKQADKECVTFLGSKLRHVCNKFVAGGAFCMKDHPRADHV